MKRLVQLVLVMVFLFSITNASAGSKNTCADLERQMDKLKQDLNDGLKNQQEYDNAYWKIRVEKMKGKCTEQVSIGTQTGTAPAKSKDKEKNAKEKKEPKHWESIRGEAWEADAAHHWYNTLKAEGVTYVGINGGTIAIIINDAQYHKMKGNRLYRNTWMRDIYTKFANQIPSFFKRAHVVVWKKVLEGPNEGVWMIGEYGINAWGNSVQRFSTVEEMVVMRDKGELR